MDHLCVRCMRVTVQNSRVSGRVVTTHKIRAFSSSTSRKDPKESSSAPPNRSRPSNPSERSLFSALVGEGVQKNAGGDTQRQPPGLLIRRVVHSRPSDAGGTTGSGESSQATRRPPGQLLVRRSGGPRSSSHRPSSSDQTDGQRQARQNRRRRNFAASSPDDAEMNPLASDEVVDNYMSTVIDPPVNPTTSLPYKPNTPEASELRADWPPTPLSTAGLTESVVQRIEWLARRLPHGYISPEALAERFHAGELVRFESSSEKENVLKIASELAQKRATTLTERKGEEVAVADMALEDLASQKGERGELVDRLVRGVYDAEQEQKKQKKKQRMPFMDNVVRNLTNNETYGNSDVAKFMAKIETLVPAQSTAAAKTPKPA